MPACRSMRWTLLAAAAVVGFGCNSNSIPDAPKGDLRTPQEVSKPAPKAEELPVIRVTPSAVRELSRIMADLRKDGHTGPLYLRLRIVPGGCMGFLHKLDVDPVASASMDHIEETEGIKVVIWKSQIEILRGATVDYGEKGGQTGFKIQNPNVDGVAEKIWLPKLAASVPESERPRKPTPLAPIGERIAELRKMAADEPKNELVHCRLGQLLMEDEQYAEAVKSFERTLELSPKFTQVYRLLGECLIELKQKDHAIEVLTKGWTTAEQQGNEKERDEITEILNENGAPVPKK